jgi:membrane protein DedA with SNARE-associated domain
VVPPAGWKAARGELNIFLVILCGIAGSIIGAVFNYYLALKLGRPLVYRLADTKAAHMMLINSESVQKAENYFNKYGRISTFIGRLIPGIRQLISIPAGLVRMNMRDFIFFTALGSAIWNIVLAVLGYFLYLEKDKLNEYYGEISIFFVVMGICFIFYILSKGFVFNGKTEED